MGDLNKEKEKYLYAGTKLIYKQHNYNNNYWYSVYQLCFKKSALFLMNAVHKLLCDIPR